MKRIFILVLAGLFLVSTGALAAPVNKVTGDARSIDTKTFLSLLHLHQAAATGCFSTAK
jgi:hypothetical protein